MMQPRACLGSPGEGARVLDLMPRRLVMHRRAGAVPGPAEPQLPARHWGGSAAPIAPACWVGFAKHPVPPSPRAAKG